MIDLSRKEAILLLLAFFFSVGWIFVVNPFLAGTQWFVDSNPVVQYLVYYTAEAVVITIVFGFVLSLAIHKEVTLPKIALNGVASWLIYSFFIDNVFSSPYAYDWLGNPLYTNVPAAFSGAAVDRMLGFLWGSVGASGIWLAFLVYVFSSVIAVFLACLILSEGRLFSVFRDGLP